MTTEDWNSQMRRGLLELCILGLLDRGPSYGYEIVSRLAAAPGLSVTEGTVYPILRRLKSLGRLSTYWKESESGPPRQYYRLSRSGRSYLAELRAEWRRLSDAVDSMIAAAPAQSVRGVG